MDMHVRFWNRQWKIKLYRALQQFKTCKENLNDKNILQVSTDGPNVIKKFVKKYSAEQKNNDLSYYELFSIGTHGLHVVNRWKIEKKRKLAVKKIEFS